MSYDRASPDICKPVFHGKKYQRPRQPPLYSQVLKHPVNAFTENLLHDTPLARNSSGTFEGYPEVESLKDDINQELEPASWWISDAGAQRMFDGATTEAQCKSYFQRCSDFITRSRRWRDIPVYPVKLDVDLYEPFVQVISFILQYFHLGDVRTVRDTHRDLLQHDERHDDDDHPDNLKNGRICACTDPPSWSLGVGGAVVGVGAHPSTALGSHTGRGSFSMTSPSPHTRLLRLRRLERKNQEPYSSVDLMVTGSPIEFDHSDPKANAWIADSERSYAKCLTPIEVKRKSSQESERSLFSQAAMYARCCINAQRNRTFVYVLMLNEVSARLYYFDHCGAMVSNCRESSRVGVDPAVCFRSIQAATGDEVNAPSQYERIFTLHLGRELQSFTATALMWASNSIRGRKTTCWRVKDAGGREYILKECSRAQGREPEWAMLDKAKDIPGVGKMVGYQVATTITNLRAFIKMQIPEALQDRERYFLLLEDHGLPIHRFSNRLQFLTALRGAVQAHWDLWNKKILHRDVSVNNILLGKPDAPESFLGFLVDLDLAIEIERTKSLKGTDARTASHFIFYPFNKGTYAFQSYIILSNVRSHYRHFRFLHDYMDDLESFFWVLIWIVIGYEIHEDETETQVIRLKHDLRPETLRAMECNPVNTADSKKAIITGEVPPVADGWGSVFATLSKDLAAFFWPRVSEKAKRRQEINEALAGNSLRAEDLPGPLIDLDAAAQEDYPTFLAIIDKAVESLKEEIGGDGCVNSGPAYTADIDSNPPPTFVDCMAPTTPAGPSPFFSGATSRSRRDLEDSTASQNKPRVISSGFIRSSNELRSFAIEHAPSPPPSPLAIRRARKTENPRRSD
ncbi:hypothetical protein BJ165DRAFT_1598986 [Panaeolus papilionaceus]|nr:hypothetical protein BJ165DRAFT_1598986 [Panaeolus papilionaceus]